MWRLAMDLLFLILITTCYYGGISGYTYIATERPYIIRYNHSTTSFANISSLRYGRDNPQYYVNIEVDMLITMDNKVLLHFSFYEFLSNEYRPSFIQMNFTWCQLIEKDMFFGQAMRQGILKKPCPHPPGRYNLQNMTIPIASIPAGFPFRKGRIYVNMTLSDGSFIGEGYIDMELRETKRKKKSKFNTHRRKHSLPFN